MKTCTTKPTGRRWVRQGGREQRCRWASGSFGARVVIMAKVPQMGRVKTRLGADIGPVAATMFYRHAARAVMLRLASDKRWQTVVAVAPDTGIATRAWPRQICRIAQGGGDLGARMQRVFDRAPPGPVLIVGTDIPQIRPHHIASALQLANRYGAVVGPSGDGGYWLIGLNRMPKVVRAFDAVRWSSPDTLNDTLANLECGKAEPQPGKTGDPGNPNNSAGVGTAGRELGQPGQRRVALTTALNDVDDGADFMAVRAWAGRVVLPFGV